MKTNTLIYHKGFSLIEVVTVLVLISILGASGYLGLSHFSQREKAKAEANKLVDQLWKLRSLGVMGMAGPCIEFLPDNVTYRIFNDRSAPAGYNSDDSIMATFTLPQGLSFQNVQGGKTSTHSVCFGGLGINLIGTANSPLLAIIGSDSLFQQKIQLLPATGTAKVL